MRFFYHLLYNPVISSRLAFVQKSSISIDYLIIVIFWGGGGWVFLVVVSVVLGEKFLF